MILALDTGTHTGWALLNGGRIYESGVQDFTKRRGESNGFMFLRFRAWLTDMLRHPVTLVVYEQAHHRGGPATEICVNLTGRVQEIATEKGIEYASVHSATLKKFVCGSGRADKAVMIAFARSILCREPTDDNEADAVCIAMWAKNERVES